MKHDQTAFMNRAYRKADVVEDRIRRFTPMVRRAAWHIHGGGRDGFEIEDLMQAGFIALTECARKHDSPTEDGFAAYAKIRVRGAMFDLVRKQMPEGRNAVRRRRQFEETEGCLVQQLGRQPTATEIATRLGIPPSEMGTYLAADISIASLDGIYDDRSLSFASDTPDAFALLAELDDRERLVTAMDSLPERLKLVLQLYFVEELNLSEIAAVLEVSVPRVHQLKAQALAKLRELMAEEA